MIYVREGVWILVKMLELQEFFMGVFDQVIICKIDGVGVDIVWVEEVRMNLNIVQ